MDRVFTVKKKKHDRQQRSNQNGRTDEIYGTHLLSVSPPLSCLSLKKNQENKNKAGCDWIVRSPGCKPFLVTPTIWPRFRNRGPKILSFLECMVPGRWKRGSKKLFLDFGTWGQNMAQIVCGAKKRGFNGWIDRIHSRNRNLARFSMLSLAATLTSKRAQGTQDGVVYDTLCRLVDVRKPNTP